MKVSVPDEIKIGSFRYAIRLFPKVYRDHSLLGQHMADDLLVKVSSEIEGDVRNEAFWHELLHGISLTYKCGLEEENVDRIAQGINQVMQSFGIELDWSDLEQLEG